MSTADTIPWGWELIALLQTEQTNKKAPKFGAFYFGQSHKNLHRLNSHNFRQQIIKTKTQAAPY